MSDRVVIDASLATLWALPEPYTEQALSLADQWAQDGTRLLAPCLILAEANNALYKRIVRGEMALTTAQAALDVILGFAFEIHEEPGLQARAMDLAHQLRRPNTYDCQYLALAEHYGCELWTGDRRLYNAVKRTIGWVKWIGDYSPPA
ncbi:MAG: type II toxin-antitoxin system VapC family toxin [Acidobacteria bacterium]|nr:type II toxin-antitoxin system VapC family toxin [Acidobacteriota bacterium]